MNILKQVLLLAVVIAVMLTAAFNFPDEYTVILYYVGGWQIGGWTYTLSRKLWPN